MKISRFNKDCGNSVDMNIMDGYLFDFPTNVVELQKDAADSFFTDAVTAPEEFKKRILLSTTIEGEEKERYFLVGHIAASQLLANNHVNKLHNIITSHIPYITLWRDWGDTYEKKRSLYQMDYPMIRNYNHT